MMMKANTFSEEILFSLKGKLSQFDEVQRKWAEPSTAVKFQILRYGEDFMLRISTNVLDHSELLVDTSVTNIVSVKHVSEISLQINLRGDVKFCLLFNLATDKTQFFSILKSVVDELKSRGASRQAVPMASPGINKSSTFPLAGASRGSDFQTKGSDIETYIDALQKAVANGDGQAASKAAIGLSQHRVKLSISADEIGDIPGNRSKFNLDVFLEDRHATSAGVKINLPNVIPNMTIGYLKKLVFQVYNFPVEVQRWIIGQKIVRDTETLIDLRVNSNTPVFIYLISAEKAGITKEGVEVAQQAMQAQQHQQMHVEYMQHQQQAGAYWQQQPIIPPRSPMKKELPPRNPARGSKKDSSSSSTPQASASPRKPTAAEVGWHCPDCTLINPPTIPGCRACLKDRPQDYIPPAIGSYIMDNEEKKKQEELHHNEVLMAEMERTIKLEEQIARDTNYQRLLETDFNSLIANTELFQCLICYIDIPEGEGVTLRECLHTFCRDCLKDYINHNTEPVIMCPYGDGTYNCPEIILEREIKALVGLEAFQQYLERGLSVAESQAQNSFHCKTPDCRSFCFYDDDDNFFNCPVCHKKNCLTCKAIHEDMNCKEYQDDLERRSANDQAAKMTQMMLEKMIQSGEAMKCPQCSIIMLKKEGCDWIKCSMCKTEVCWVTKGARWGPAGSGDITGGCKCRVQGRKCHVNCQNCH